LVSLTVFLGWPQNCDPPIFTYRVAGIIGMSHHVKHWCFFLNVPITIILWKSEQRGAQELELNLSGCFRYGQEARPGHRGLRAQPRLDQQRCCWCAEIKADGVGRKMLRR
jgi:hypothetical protein